MWDRLKDWLEDHPPSLLPGEDVSLRDNYLPDDLFTDPDNLDLLLDSGMRPDARAAMGNMNEALLDANASAMRDAMIAAVTGAAVEGLGSLGDDIGRGLGAFERHHQLPRQFRRQFERAGLNIVDYVIDLERSRHRLKPNGLHTGTDNWNKQWRDFFDEHKNPRPEEILEYLDQLRREFGLD